ncbi:MAG: tetratricopeptide repeat protein [Myxococcales bacterium]|nr:MAG: tetratricopeptide repeat protein [Myxococcales bacterium]
MKRFDEAQQIVDALAPEKRNTTEARIALAQLFLAKGQAREGLKEISSIAELPEASAELLVVYGDLLYLAGWLGRAGSAYEAALKKDPDSPTALLGRAKVEFRAGRKDNALRVAEQAGEALKKRAQPETVVAELWLLRGEVYLSMGAGKQEDAVFALKKAVSFDQAPPESYFWLGEALSKGSAAQAKEAYENYLKADPDGEYAARARRAIGE